ncbi:hypothetical protein F5B20DRAFT_558669 [Whalleya microplaca]|nr:hypothetical protein F5B20DRAFT_558669 [Whalleya microplaca]
MLPDPFPKLQRPYKRTISLSTSLFLVAMAQTRARTAAQKRGNPTEDQDTPTRKPRRRKTYHKSGNPPARARGRKRAVEEDIPEFSPKRPRISRPSAAEDTSRPDAPDNANFKNPVEFWIQRGSWPRQYFESDMEHSLARKRSLSSIGGRKRSNSASSATPSDQKPREEKSAQYRDARYETLLATKGSLMTQSKLGITDQSKTLCRNLLEMAQTFPENTLFRHDIFMSTCQKIQNRNEARIIKDISALIVPSAESFATCGAAYLEISTESVNEGWSNSIPLTGTRPQPDYSVGFQREAFSREQLEKLSPFIGDFVAGDLSYFMATYYMYFPFLASEVKCGSAALDIADRQNAHSMTLAARGIVELFRLVGREPEVNRELLAFSISHDHQAVRIYGYYPVLEGKDTRYYRHPIRNFCFTELDGKEKWTAYRFTKNIYDIWVPNHFKRICSAIDQLPSKVDFGVPALSESAGLSRGLESHHLESSEADSASLLTGKDDRLQRAAANAMVTPDTSFTKPGPSKRRKSPMKKS